jgi:hypothetical protein
MQYERRNEHDDLRYQPLRANGGKFPTNHPLVVRGGDGFVPAVPSSGGIGGGGDKYGRILIIYQLFFAVVLRTQCRRIGVDFNF